MVHDFLMGWIVPLSFDITHWYQLSYSGNSLINLKISINNILILWKQGHGICTLDSSFGIAILLVPWAVMLLIQVHFFFLSFPLFLFSIISLQVVLIALIFRFIFNINNVFRVHSTGAKGLLWLCILMDFYFYKEMLIY